MLSKAMPATTAIMPIPTIMENGSSQTMMPTSVVRSVPTPPQMPYAIPKLKCLRASVSSTNDAT